MPQPEAAVAIVHTREDAGSILLIRRADRVGDSWSGHWSFPGGRCDSRDTDALDTALRELHEECGILLPRESMEVSLPLKLARRMTPPFLWVAPFVLRVDRRMETVLDPAEAAGSAWVPLDALLDPAAHKLRPVPARPPEVLFPAVDVDGWPLWGFTYRLITGWLQLEPSCRPVERAGALAAETVLRFVLGHGCVLERGWTDGAATVRGEIPVLAVLEHFSAPSNFLAAVNCLEVRPGAVRIAGLAWEEYWIRTAG
jgi:8-oxo-dGTP pyrophosphatase MutT (NUDIX family)